MTTMPESYDSDRFGSREEQEIIMKYLDTALSGYVDSTKTKDLHESERAVTALETLVGIVENDETKALRLEHEKYFNITSEMKRHEFRRILVERIHKVMEIINKGLSRQKPFLK